MMKKIDIQYKKLLLGLMVLIGTTQSTYGSMEDDPIISTLIMDKFEIFNNDEKTKAWEGSLWIGHDINKFYLYSQGEVTSEGLERSQNELVYSRAIAPFWDVQIGIAYDKNSDASKTWAEIAISGLAPYYFETRATLLLNNDENIGLRLEVEYEALITQKLILTPSLEADFYTKDDSQLGLGSGLSALEAGLRLRYEFKREFAPYIGITWEKTFGNTREYNPIDETNFLVGVRFWF